MHIISTDAEYEVANLLQNVRKDTGSWAGWKCLKIQTTAMGRAERHERLRRELVRLLECFDAEKRATAFICGLRTIWIFSKDFSAGTLDALGRQMMELAASEAGVAACHTVFDVEREYERLPEGNRLPSFARSAGKAIRGTGEGSLQGTQRPKILVVEDDAVTRWLVTMILKDKYQIATAQDGGKAMALYHAYRPDIVLMDIGLPDRNGKDVMERLMQCDPGAYVVMCSGDDSLENISDSIERGARAFLAKPVNRERLLQAVQAEPDER